MMHKHSCFAAALAVALVGASPLALAQSDTTMHRTVIASEMIKPDQVRASKFIGSSVYDRNNAKIGSVEDIVLDRDGHVAAVVVSVGGFLGAGSKYVAVRLSDIKTDNDRLTLDMTKPQLERMAAYHLTDRNTGAGTTQSPVHGGTLGSGTGR